MDEQTAWQKVWQVILSQVEMPDQQPLALADDFDFLQAGEPHEQLVIPLSSRLPSGDQRALACAEMLPLLKIATSRFRQNWQQILVDERLGCLDGDGAWLLLHLIQASSGLEAEEHGPLLLLLQRATLSDDADLAVTAVAVAAQLGLNNVQVQIAQRLLSGPAQLGHARVDALLRALEGMGDGRCVRAMEQLLHERGGELSDAHAFVARRIVQGIRRLGRR